MPATHSDRVMVAMSGGVDSSVATLLAKEAGYTVCGVTGKMLRDGADESDDAKQVCKKLGIDHITVDLRDVFEREIIKRFVCSYESGCTPNPCVDCNRYVKFDALFERCCDLGFDKIATGHYARVRHNADTNRLELLRAVDLDKDQSYMLCRLTQEQLARSIFPLGGLSKPEVRKLAETAGLPTASKSESQDICFIPDGDYVSFISDWHEGNTDNKKDGFASGDIENVDGKRLGEHRGLINYTIGQRKGIGIAAPEPLYVVGKDTSRNVLIVGTRKQLMTQTVSAAQTNFVSLTPEETLDRKLNVRAKTSYRMTPQAATAIFTDDSVELAFDEPIVKPAPGQTVAIFDEAGDRVLAGAIIV